MSCMWYKYYFSYKVKNFYTDLFVLVCNSLHFSFFEAKVEWVYTSSYLNPPETYILILNRFHWHQNVCFCKHCQWPIVLLWPILMDSKILFLLRKLTFIFHCLSIERRSCFFPSKPTNAIFDLGNCFFRVMIDEHFKYW